MDDRSARGGLRRAAWAAARMTGLSSVLRTAGAAAVAMVLLVPAAFAGTVKLESPHTVARTMDRLVAAARAEGAKIVTRTDLGKVMKERGYVIPPEEEIIFGAPVFGDKDQQQAIRALGIELRAKAYVLNDKVWLVYEDMETIARSKSLNRDDPVVVEIDRVVTRIMEKAVAP